MDAVNCGSTRSGKCFESQADTIIPLRVGTAFNSRGRRRRRRRRRDREEEAEEGAEEEEEAVEEEVEEKEE